MYYIKHDSRVGPQTHGINNWNHEFQIQWGREGRNREREREKIAEMVRTPCCDKSGMKKGTWTPEEDRKLIAYVTKYGCWNWRQLPKFAGKT